MFKTDKGALNAMNKVEKRSKTQVEKTVNGDNLAKQNDAKSIILLVFFPKRRLQNEENVCVLLDFRT